ncbi:hypothetical protein [Flavobacterium sp. CAU 1735]|uniref:hypothetical protein n=1 Tax=Flavobacterium sp. CAU 1735 TaxID=3140361 RepID=UPI00326044FE
MQTENNNLQNDNCITFEIRLDELIEVGQALAEHTKFQLFEKVHYVSATQSVLSNNGTVSQKVTINMDCDFIIVIHDGTEIPISISNWNSLCQLAQHCISKVDEVTNFIKNNS